MVFLSLVVWSTGTVRSSERGRRRDGEEEGRGVGERGEREGGRANPAAVLFAMLRLARVPSQSILVGRCGS